MPDIALDSTRLNIQILAYIDVRYLTRDCADIPAAPEAEKKFLRPFAAPTEAEAIPFIPAAMALYGVVNTPAIALVPIDAIFLPTRPSPLDREDAEDENPLPDILSIVFANLSSFAVSILLIVC